MPSFHHLLYKKSSPAKNPVYKMAEKDFAIGIKNLFRKNKSFKDLVFSGRQIENVSLPSANFEGAKGTFTGFHSIDFTGANFSNATLENCTFSNCDLEHANFSGTSILRSSFNRCLNMASVNFTEATFIRGMGTHTVDKLIYCGQRMDGYDILAFLTKEKSILINAGCRLLLYPEYVSVHYKDVQLFKQLIKSGTSIQADVIKHRWMKLFYRRQMLNTIAEFAKLYGVKLTPVNDNLNKLKPKSFLTA